ncbi:hypothetical protein BG011_004225 [Mortierella polycephala]|uniref:Ribosomal protein S21 n=1 Tax=Mortierella polycephala TaxID=41804 RepID=A0A9P6Q2J5_9FUNG|nr:hypothetical protein BG011_004225 [Mortierella polycephala]
MFRALTKSSTAVAAVAQRQALRQTQMFAATSTAAFHSSSVHQNNNNNSTSDIFAALYSNSSNSKKDTKTPFSLFGNGARTGGKSIVDMPMFGFSSTKANTTANPIHLEATHPTEGRSFCVASPSAVDQTYRRLRTVIKHSNMKRELRLRRTYETGHMRKRRENQERNKKLFGNMVRKKIALIKLMKLRTPPSNVPLKLDPNYCNGPNDHPDIRPTLLPSESLPSSPSSTEGSPTTMDSPMSTLIPNPTCLADPESSTQLSYSHSLSELLPEGQSTLG